MSEPTLASSPSSSPSSTRADEITFFEDRAQVRRLATLTLGPGAHVVELSGLSVLVDDPSLVARVLAKPDEPLPARVLQAKVRRRIISRQELEGSQLAALEARARQAERAQRELELAMQRLDSRQRRLDTLEQTLLHQLHDVPAGQGAQAERWRGAFEAVDEQLDELLEQRHALLHQRRETQRELDRARALMAQGSASQRDLEAIVELQVEVLSAQPVELELTYFVPCALWRPEHMARLEAASGQPSSSGQMTLTLMGAAWQITGERWERVLCRFSTARPTQAASAPPLVDDVLRSRPKTERERRVVDVEAREQTISLTGVQGGDRAVDEMPGVDDGGEPLTFTARERVTIPSTAEPLRVQIDAVTLPCKVELVAYPELSPAPHLRATATWSASWPLLAGPVTLVRGGELAGRARTRFVASGDAFELGFGVDPGVRIQRELSSKDTSKKLSRKDRLERTVRLFISNIGDSPRELTLIERVPVSEIEAVEVTLDEDAGGKMDKDGFLRIPLKLSARQTERRVVRYTLETAGHVNLRL